MNPAFNKICSLDQTMQTTWHEIKNLERLINDYEQPHTLEFWDDSNITFYKEDIQALLDSKNRKVEEFLNAMREILGEKEK